MNMRMAFALVLFLRQADKFASKVYMHHVLGAVALTLFLMR